MCGICGVFGLGDVDTVRAMLGTLTHRGPDDEHAVSGRDFALGACRLSIVDVEGGRQPVSNDAGKVGILARDRMGKKPLYYHEHRGALYFASEIKALLRIPGFERRIDLEALHHYLSYKHVPHPLSIFEGVRMLPPAHLLVYRPGAPPTIRRYWDVDFSPSAEAAEM